MATLIAETGGQNVMLAGAMQELKVDDARMLSTDLGPVLHVIRYRARDLEKILDEINNTGYGLTLGVQSRIEKTQQTIAKTAGVGDCYINREMTGAVVGVQPFERIA